MKININFKEREFEKALIRNMAKQILDNEYSEAGIIKAEWDNPVRDIFIEKARKCLKEDKKFDEKIMKDIRKEMKDKKLIKSVAREIVKEKMEEHDY